MTTIAYRDGLLVADTLVSRNGAVSGYVQKIHRAGGLRFGFCGTLSLDQRFADWLRGGLQGTAPSLRCGDSEGCVAVFMPDGSIVEWNGDCPPDVIRAPYAAYGSGAPFALGAMAAGATAEEAVRAAAAVDHNTGGAITVLAQ